MLLSLAGGSAHAADLSLAGVFGGKAVLVIDGGAPRTLAVGARSPEGIRLLSVDRDSAWVEVEGRRVQLRIGENVASSRSSDAGAAAIHLNADSQGHFLSDGAINGTPVRFLLDTGATVIALGRSDALRANIRTASAPAMAVQTANGVVRAWRVKLVSVKLGGVTLSNVDAAVMETDMPHVLLGMSFLNRMDMQRTGQIMTLRQRF
ncbi:clan AA aspartic protease, family protein [Methyloversatilis sp. RAC08]|uniref:retropepsin-like aspartic protease family protein n=1 Tax=Methyloversatilis sp. RAC08 TaxID=1842540 RepID=UPI00085738DB|nr:TIGR02281 family clan AA aspartic protease [Methyloversatilis sp. RAC08]AOF82131.1 clan AA aspartic protease, family protein [Methyloversatilis sp. RAC08]